jgi:hypothetical protein
MTLGEVFILYPKTMKTRTAQDIRRDLTDASRRLGELKNSNDSAMRHFGVTLTDQAKSAMQLLQNLIDYYEQELSDAACFDKQLTLGF